MIRFFSTVFFLLIAIDHAYGSCSSEIVEWATQDGKRKCSAQLFGNGEIKLGFTQIVSDPVYNGSEALFTCTEKGWNFTSGTCLIREAKPIEECIEAAISGTNADHFSRIGKSLAVQGPKGEVTVYSNAKSTKVEGASCRVEETNLDKFLVSLFNNEIDQIMKLEDHSEKSTRTLELIKSLKICSKTQKEVASNEISMLARLGNASPPQNKSQSESNSR